MQPHRRLESVPTESSRVGSERQRKSDQDPLDARWLENEGMKALGRHERTRSGLAAALQRTVSQRCARTHEDPSDALESLPLVLDRLEARGYLNDREYADRLRIRFETRGCSQSHIAHKLREKGFDAALVDDLLAHVDPESERRAAWQTAKRKRLGPFCPDEVKRKRERDRHLAALGRGGFPYEIACEVIDAPSPPPGDSLLATR